MNSGAGVVMGRLGWHERVEVVERGGHAGGTRGCGAVSAERGDVAAHLGQGVRGTGQVRGDGGVEHGHVIVVVAAGEDAGGRQAEAGGEMGEGGAFAVGAVGEAQVDAIAFVAQIGDFRQQGIDVGADVVHFPDVGGNDAGRVLGQFDVGGEGFAFDEALDLAQESPGFVQQVPEGVVGLAVPVAEIRPSATGQRGCGCRVRG